MSVPDPQTATTLPRVVVEELAVGTDWLGTWWPPVVLIVLAAALVAAGLYRGRRRGRRRGTPADRDRTPADRDVAAPPGLRRRRWPLMVAAVAALLLASGAAVNSVVGYVPSVSAAWLLATGTRDVVGAGVGQVAGRTVPAPSDTRMPASTTWVYTPPGYQAGSTTRYPVVYLVHGSPGQSSDWFTAGAIAHVMDVLIDNRLIRPMIVVAPDVNGVSEDDTECLDSTRGGSQVETYLNDVVVPWVDRHYATLTDYAHRAIGGMSAGGFCAVDQGLRHPELYGEILALEPYDNPGSGGRAMLSTQAEYDAHSPGLYLPVMTFEHAVPTFLDIGELARGGDGRETGRLAAQLVARGQDVLFREEPDQGHTWTMARTGIPYGLIFASEHMPR